MPKAKWWRQLIGSGDVGAVEAVLGSSEPRVVPAVLDREERYEAGVDRHTPSELLVSFGRVAESPTVTLECAVTGVQLSWREPGAEAVCLRRGADAALLRAPAADLEAAADELKKCESMEDVAIVFARTVAQGVR